MRNLEDELTQNLDQRLKVLSEIERAIFTKRYRLNKTHLDILSIQSITMIYSIWEGFIQTSFQTYLTHLNSLNIPFDDFSEEIKIFHFENKFKQLKSYPKKHSKKIKFYNDLKSFFETEKHNVYTNINTNDNVSFSVLNAILRSFSLLPFPEYWSIYRHPNPNLKQSMHTFLRYRNGVAHGGDISSEEKVTQGVFSKYKKLVSDLMYEIVLKILEGSQQRKYLKIQ